MFKILKILIATTLVLAIAYLSGRWAYGKLFTSNTHVIGTTGQPRYLNPVLAQSKIDRTLSAKIYRGLVKYNENFEPTGDLAESWQAEENGRVYLVNLKTGQLWQDGKLITAEDVVFTYQLMPDLSAVAVEKIGDATIKFTLPEPLASLTEVLSRGVMPKHIWKDEDLRSSQYNLKPVGSGSYEFKNISINDGQVKSLEFRIQNVESETGKHPNIRYTFYTTSEEVVNAYKIGEIDNFKTTDATVAKTFKSWPNTVVSEITNYELRITNYAVFFNLRNEDSLIADVNTRRALAHKLIDASIGLTGPLPQNHWAYVKHPIPEANADFTDINLKIIFLEDVQTQLIASLTRAWSGAQLETAVTQFPPSGDWDILAAPLEIPRDPDQYVYWHSTQSDLKESGLNVSGYANRRVDKALEDGRKLLNKDERQSAYDIWQRWLAEDVPAVFVKAPVVYNISRK